MVIYKKTTVQLISLLLPNILRIVNKEYINNIIFILKYIKILNWMIVTDVKFKKNKIFYK